MTIVMIMTVATGTDSYDPAFNVCRGTDPRCYHDWAHEEREGNRVLIYTRTAGPRHANLGPRLAAGLNPPLGAGNVVQNSLKSWLEQEGIEVDWTEDVTRLSNLHRYKAVIFASTSRDTLFAHGRAVDPALAINTATSAHLDAAKTALRQYIRAGGGFVGIHNAFGTEYNWPWYEGLLGNANYYDHGANQDGMVNIVARNDSSTNGLPKTWPFRDEWYNLEPFPTRVKFLATVDEEHAGDAPRDSSGAWRLSSGGLVSVLRRRAFVGDDARTRRRCVHGWLWIPRPAAVQADDRQRHQVRDGTGAVLHRPRSWARLMHAHCY